ncbi:MAG: adenylyltransferase/cytidyltransferase family protein [Chthoniobacterales bacterium]
MSDKIQTVEALAETAVRLRREGRKLVATNGCFDLLHVGHVRYLRAARDLGDCLAVGLNGDKSVRQLKGAGRPLNRADDRAEVLAALEAVDYVAVFPELRASQFLRTVRPAIYVKGGDYTPETLDRDEKEALAAIGAEIVIIPFAHGYSTSGLIDSARS